MNRSSVYKWAAGLALAGALTFAVVAPIRAANLTNGNYTYLIQGEEQTFPVDPISRSGGMLLPLEVFQAFGITVEGALDKVAILTKDTVTARLTVGRAVAEVNGKALALATAPVRVSGRLFVPADLLNEFGVEFAQDGSFVSVSQFSPDMPALAQLSGAQWKSMLEAHTISANVKMDSGVFARADFTLLTPSMLTAENLDVSYGVRARLLGLMETNTLVLTRLSNTSFKSGALVTTGAYLVDSRRTQYDPQGVFDIGQGLLTAKTAPNADRTGVLLFPKLAADAGDVSLYYEASQLILGTFVHK